MFFYKDSKIEAKSEHEEGLKQASMILKESLDKCMQDMQQDMLEELDRLRVPPDEREEYIQGFRKTLKEKMIESFKIQLQEKAEKLYENEQEGKVSIKLDTQ